MRRTHANVLPFQPRRTPKANAAVRQPPPDCDASFEDDMQWLTLEHPAQAVAIHYFVKRIVSKHRPSPPTP